jgi:hypothetical protein
LKARKFFPRVLWLALRVIRPNLSGRLLIPRSPTPPLSFIRNGLSPMIRAGLVTLNCISVRPLAVRLQTRQPLGRQLESHQIHLPESVHCRDRAKAVAAIFPRQASVAFTWLTERDGFCTERRNGTRYLTPSYRVYSKFVQQHDNDCNRRHGKERIHLSSPCFAHLRGRQDRAASFQKKMRR